MGEAAITASAPRVWDRLRAGEVVWRVLAGTAAGAVAGFLVGGIGGRLAMLLLRLTSSEAVIGMTSDDGFEIGVVSTRTFNLLVATTGLGGVAGAFYAGARGAIPERMRLPLWTAVSAFVGGAALVHDDGIDFDALEPHWLAVMLFVALPAVAAVVLVLLAERWSYATPWGSRRLTAGLVVAAAATTLGLVVSLAVGVAMLAAFGVLALAGPHARRLCAIASVLVPLVLVALAIVAAFDLVPETRTIVG
jgi:hypothetical protein